LISLGLTQLGLSFLNPFLDLNLSLSFANDLRVPAFLLGLFVFVSLFSGLYPSLILSGFKPVLALKNKISSKNSSSFHLRRGLVVIQFVISQFFIIGTIVVISQMNFFLSKDLGFSKDAIITVPIPEPENPTEENNGSKMRTLAAEVSNLSDVYNISLCSTPPASGSVSGTDFKVEGQEAGTFMETQVKQVDGNYVPLFDLRLIAGENIGDLDTATSFIVNRKLTEVAGFTDPSEIIGKRIEIWGKNLPVAGVVENFHATNLRKGIEPIVLFNRVRGYYTMAAKINANSYQASIDQIKILWVGTYPKHVFSDEVGRAMPMVSARRRSAAILRGGTALT
jgi:hypothetical protein